MGKPRSSTNDLANRMNDAQRQGGGIRVHEHPELETRKPGLANPITQIASVVKAVRQRMNSTGSHTSPTTVHDHGSGSTPTLSDAERERIARKYVDR